MKTNFTILLLFAVALFIGCDKARVFEQNTTIDNTAWDRKQIIRYEVDITDTLSLNKFYINIRNTGNYQYSNIFLFVNTTFPNKKKSRDTLECVLADQRGKWLGKGLGDLLDNQILFKKGVRFPMSGKYIFEIEQAMRVEQLTEIADVGLRIEKL